MLKNVVEILQNLEGKRLLNTPLSPPSSRNAPNKQPSASSSSSSSPPPPQPWIAKMALNAKREIQNARPVIFKIANSNFEQRKAFFVIFWTESESSLFACTRKHFERKPIRSQNRAMPQPLAERRTVYASPESLRHKMFEISACKFLAREEGEGRGNEF